MTQLDFVLSSAAVEQNHHDDHIGETSHQNGHKADDVCRNVGAIVQCSLRATMRKERKEYK